MTVIQKRKILENICGLKHDIAELKRVRMEVACSGYSSATMSSGGGSKTFSRMDLEKLTSTINELEHELNQYMSLLANGTTTPFRTIATIWS